MSCLHFSVEQFYKLFHKICKAVL